VVKWRADPKSLRAAIQAILAKDPTHTPLYFKRQRHNVVKIPLINLKKISGFLLQYLHPAPSLLAFP
jgi:hypothetical protein